MMTVKEGGRAFGIDYTKRTITGSERNENVDNFSQKLNIYNFYKIHRLWKEGRNGFLIFVN